MALATGVMVVAPAPAADATTTVTTKGNVVTIHVSVDVYGADGQIGPGGQPLVEYWEQVLQDTWGSAFDQLPYKNCLKFKLDLDLKARSRDARDRAGRDRLHATAPRTGGGWGGVGWGGVPETSRNPRTGDGTRSFENDRVGTLPVDAPPTVIAHEFGHLFGLGDDRKDGQPKGGREGTVMVGGVPGVDVNVVQKIDQNLVNRIGEVIKQQLENEGKKFPKCETWEGTFNTRLPACNSGLVSEGTVTLGVAPDGSVTGTGTHEIGGACAGSPLDTTKYPFGVSGTRDRDGFHLTLAEQYSGVEAPIDLTVAGTSAEGSAQWGSTAIAAMTLECKKNCEGEAVG